MYTNIDENITRTLFDRLSTREKKYWNCMPSRKKNIWGHPDQQCE